MRNAIDYQDWCTYDCFYVGHKVVESDKCEFGFKVSVFAQVASRVAAKPVRNCEQLRRRRAHLFSARKLS